MKQSVAFSNSDDVWTTRLSYISSCVAHIKQHHISCPQRAVNLFWVHDESAPSNNSFYGQESVPSVVGVTFNQFPSNNKIFKALSIETPDYRRLQGANTFIANNGAGALKKTVTISLLKEKGGILYGEIPGQLERTIANIEYIGTISDIQDPGPLEGMGTFYVLDGSSDASWTGQEAEAAVPASGASAMITNTYNGGFFVDGNPGFQVGDAIFLEYLSSNGDQARGQFAESLISLGSEDFEVYSINVDFEPTDLDHAG